jgi:hypothetical protein
MLAVPILSWYAQTDCYLIIYWIYEIHTLLTEEKIQ